MSLSTIIVSILVYFLCLWLFRLGFTVLLIKILTKIPGKVKESLKGANKA